MIEPIAHPDGVVLAVRVQPKARRAGIVGEHAGALKVAVTQPPERGKANQAVLELLCEKLALKKAQVRLLRGEAARDKRFLLIGVKPGELQERLARLAADFEQ